jgi:hypothetical protein
MGRLLTKALSVVLVGSFAVAAHADTRVKAMGEFGLTTAGRYESYLDGGMGKLRFGNDDQGAQFFGGFLQAENDFGEHWDSVISVDINDQLDNPIGFTEAILRYRPMPFRGARFRGKLGLFRPPISFEHSADGWATRYTVQASALNSWVGEELGAYGLEASVSNDRASGTRLDWGLKAAVFYGNDPVGTMLAWRGWSPNNVQTRPGDKIPFADLPFFAIAPSQSPQAEPYLEIDNRPGYYVAADLGAAQRFKLRLMHYDNRADPEINKHGQYAWRTFFNSAGFQTELPFGVGLIGQYLWGRTYMGQKFGNERAVDIDFDAKFVLLTKVLGENRFSVRREWFAVDDKDGRSFDPSDESMRGWTLSYQRQISSNWRIAFEWLEVDGKRDARELVGLQRKGTEDALYATLRWWR